MNDLRQPSPYKSVKTITIPFIKPWNETKEVEKFFDHLDYVSFDPYFMNENSTDYKVRQLGSGYILTELKDGTLFEGDFEDWDTFKKEHPKLIK